MSMSSSTAATEPWDLGLDTDQAAQGRVRALVVDHFDSVWRLLRRLGVPESAVDDAAQLVFLIATKKLARVVPESEQSFLYGVALRVAADERRKAKRRLEVSGVEMTALEDAGPPPDALVEQRKARALMDHVLESMPLELRSVFVLYEMEEMTMAEIAALLGIPPGSVASRLRRAREHFHEYVRRYRAKWRHGREAP
jgi:RNA polymerase sigma-70 factor (ECF subfamily)